MPISKIHYSCKQNQINNYSMRRTQVAGFPYRGRPYSCNISTISFAKEIEILTSVFILPWFGPPLSMPYITKPAHTHVNRVTCCNISIRASYIFFLFSSEIETNGLGQSLSICTPAHCILHRNRKLSGGSRRLHLDGGGRKMSRFDLTSDERVNFRKSCN